MYSVGHIVYHGPREQVADFFAQQGFVCPPRKGIADFLQEVTSSKDQEVCLDRMSLARSESPSE